MCDKKQGTLELEIERILTAPDVEDAAEQAVKRKKEKKSDQLGKSEHACKQVKVHGADEEYMTEFCTNPHFVCKKCGRCGQRPEQLCRPAPIPQQKP